MFGLHVRSNWCTINVMITDAQVDTEQELASLCGVLNQSYARLVTLVAQALVG